MISIPGRCITECGEQNDIDWYEMYTTLRPIAKQIVYSYHTQVWRGQENDIAEDVTQETIRKLFEYDLKVKRGESVPIHAFVPMMRVIAHNYSRDMLRHDNRVTRIDVNDPEVFLSHEEIDVEECATENAYNDMLFRELARAIASFPVKQRQALLIDIAIHMSFEPQPTPLQRAFSNAGIQLHMYREMQPVTSKEHNRHTSLLAHAYKRVANQPCAQYYKKQADHRSE